MSMMQSPYPTAQRSAAPGGRAIPISPGQANPHYRPSAGNGAYAPQQAVPAYGQAPAEDRIRQLTTQRPADFQGWWNSRQSSPLLQQQSQNNAYDASWRSYNAGADLDRRERALQERRDRAAWQQRLGAARETPQVRSGAARGDYGDMMEQYRIWEGRQRLGSQQWEAGVRAGRPSR